MTPFEALPFLGQAHVQTVLGALAMPRHEPPTTPQQIVLPDGDRLVSFTTYSTCLRLASGARAEAR